MTAPRPAAQRVFEAGRLAEYREAADQAFWERHWRDGIAREAYRGAEQGLLGRFEEPFTRWLPEQGRILEAGCGTGTHVLALRKRGYDVEGVEWSAATVEAVLALHPDLPIRAGDVTRLAVPAGHYRGYISLGVVEHRAEGPEPFLREAARVLGPDGVALISVPYLHALRRIKARLGLYRGRPGVLPFYQYTFSAEGFATCLREAGFEIVERRLYDGFKGLKDEVPLVRRALAWRGVGWRLRRLLRRSRWLERTMGHMALFVCRKNEA